jgi:ParB family chromosome partitioning protein
VRQVEQITRHESRRAGTSSKNSKHAADKSTDTLALEKQLANALGLVISIDHRGEGGVISIRYRNLDQLDDLTRRLGGRT